MYRQFKEVIESELKRRAQILVCARRIAIAEEILVERKGGKAEVIARIHQLLDQAEDPDGDDDDRHDALQLAKELAQKNGLDLNKLAMKRADADSDTTEQPPKKNPKPESDDDDLGDDADDDNGVDDAAGNPKFGAGDDDRDSDAPVGNSKPAANQDQDKDKNSGGVLPAKTQQGDSATQGAHIPDAGADAIGDGEVVYKVKDNKFGEKSTAIPQAWFDTWLSQKKLKPGELQAKLKDSKLALQQLKPPTNGDKESVEHFKAHRDGYSNKIKAITAHLSGVEKSHNTDIDKHNKKQDRRKERIHNLVDVLSNGNPLLKTLIGLMADRLLKSKEKVNYSGNDSGDMDFDTEDA